MPELPEVETIKTGLLHLKGRKIKQIFRSDKRLRIESGLDLKNLKNLQIIDFTRRARYLLINFEKNFSLIIHLGMSGSLIHSGNQDYKTKKHDHFICTLDDDSLLIFNDPRRFGFIELVENDNLPSHKMLSKLGPEPLSNDFNAKYLEEKIKNKNMNIKTAMMDNEIVVGVGNIYINESLFEARISPLKTAKTLNKKQIEKLVKTIKETLQHAILLGGSSINDYVDSKGNKGAFQNKFKIYGNHNKSCVKCQGKIEKITQNGRSSFYCANCQK